MPAKPTGSFFLKLERFITPSAAHFLATKPLRKLLKLASALRRAFTNLCTGQRPRNERFSARRLTYCLTLCGNSTKPNITKWRTNSHERNIQSNSCANSNGLLHRRQRYHARSNQDRVS